MIAEIVQVRAVGDLRETPLELALASDVVELALAVEAPVRAVGDVAGPRDLVRVDEPMHRADLAGDARRVRALARGQARAHGRHADGALPELFRRHGKDESAVDAARVADQDGP